MIGSAALLEPVETVAMSLTVDKVKLAIVVHVVTKDGEAGIADIDMNLWWVTAVPAGTPMTLETVSPERMTATARPRWSSRTRLTATTMATPK